MASSKEIEIACEPKEHQFEKKSTDVFSLLPEVLAIVFNKLSIRDKGRAAQVCKVWNEIIREKSSWRDAECPVDLRHEAKKQLQILEKSGIQAVKICKLEESQGLCNLFEHMPKLKSVTFTARLDFEIIRRALPSSYPSLNSLDLSGCQGVNNGDLAEIVEYFPNLRHLKLPSYSGVTDEGIATLVGINLLHEDRLKLQTLSLVNAKITDEALRYISISLASNLISLNITACRQITDKGLTYLAKCTKLTELNLSNSTVTVVGIRHLIEGGLKLSSLRLTQCLDLQDEAMDCISRSSFDLRELSLSFCKFSDVSLGKIVCANRNLKNLHLKGCKTLSPAHLLSAIEDLPRLEYLEIFGCHDDCEIALKKTKRLIRQNLAKNERVSGSLVIALGDEYRRPLFCEFRRRGQ